MPDFWIWPDPDQGGAQRVIEVRANDMTVDGVPRNGITLSTGQQVDWRWVKHATQGEQAAVGIYWGFNDPDSAHPGMVPDGDYTIEPQGTDPETYLRARPWAPPPASITLPMPPIKLMPFLGDLPQRNWQADWATIKGSGGERRRQVMEGVEQGTVPFYFHTFLRFATVVLGAPPTPGQQAAAQTRWITWIEMPVGDLVTEPSGPVPPWQAILWLAGSHVTSEEHTWRATFDYALPSERPSASSVWDML